MPIEPNVTTKTPRTLPDWLKLLDSVRLPVPVASHERVLAALGDSRSSLREIAELMQDSPALVLSVIREANHHVHQSLAEPVESLEIALNRLGLKRTEELLERLPTSLPEDMPRGLRQLLLISQHAAQQANGLFAARLARLWQEVHWGSLLFLSPLWPLAVTHAGLLEEWELRVVHKGEAAAKVELELFGVRLLNLCQSLAQLWRLPAWIHHGYNLLLDEQREFVKVLHIARDDEHRLRQQQRLDDDPGLRRWLNQPANTVVLANGLALASHEAWDTPHALRWQYLTCLYLQMPLDELQQQVHQQAVQNARHYAAPGLWHPAEALVWPWNIRRVHRGMLPAPPPTADDLATWRKYCAELLIEPSRFTNAMHLTTYARDALVACGMKRVMLLMIDKEQTSLRVHQVAGLPADAANLNLLISQSTVLQRLLGKAAHIRLTPQNNAQFSALIPSSLRGLFKGDNLLLRSLASNDRVVMLVAADQGGGPFSEISVQAFGKTAQCIERALTTFSKRGA
ncbi:HDOD domain-containing protein [Pseudomonas sp.]|uniref:HDOD domain-containing protein n=1 Tax=Pseudomonas sp. TaxID=306 RepID=UPI003CC61CFA